MSKDVKLSKNAWNQLKALTAKDLISALEKDPNWEFKEVRNNKYAFYNPNMPPTMQEIVIHYHPKKGGYGPSLMKSLIGMIGWTEEDLKKLKLIK